MNVVRFIIEGCWLSIVSTSDRMDVETINFLGEEFKKDFPNSSMSIPEVFVIRTGPFDGYVAVKFKLEKVLATATSREAVAAFVEAKYFPIDNIGGKWL